MRQSKIQTFQYIWLHNILIKIAIPVITVAESMIFHIYSQIVLKLMKFVLGIIGGNKLVAFLF